MSILGGSGAHRVYWKSQLPIDYIDTSLTINDWETVSADLSGGKPVKLWRIRVEQTNNGATAEDIELEITINGTAYTFSGTLNSGAGYKGVCSGSLSAGDFSFIFGAANTDFTVNSEGNSNTAVPFFAESVGLIRVRQTSTVDLVSAQIEVNVTWDKLVGV